MRNGHIHDRKQRYRCRACRRQLVGDSTKKVIGLETRALVDKLLLEKVPLAGITRVLEVSSSWLQEYVNKKYAAVPQTIDVLGKKGRSPSNAMKRTVARLYGRVVA